MCTPWGCSQLSGPTWLSGWMLISSLLGILSTWLGLVQGVDGMTETQIRELRRETEYMFYHGFDNYMRYAFPEDELRPLTCAPLTRDREHPEDVGLNDALGNYSLTLIDSLSTLAILSSSPDSGPKAWRYFQDGVADLVRLYGDGTNGPGGRGERARGFDLDSKVQVFETVIRGLGGLLSAHLFAVGDLPVRGYSPPEEEREFAAAWNKSGFPPDRHGIVWPNGLVYDGQLLRLAKDLGDRLLPVFYTETGIPYPRVNLRYGIPFYKNSPLNAWRTEKDDSRASRHANPVQPEVEDEATDTSSAGAGSLVLEFTTLSRLTGDGRYEEHAKRAFWAVWNRRSDVGLLATTIDVESGKWLTPYTWIGAGIDSFFEYAFKSYILLSVGQRPPFNSQSPYSVLDNFYVPLDEVLHSPDAFLRAWQEAKASIKRHLYRGKGYQYPHFIQGDFRTGATRAFWIDSLSAFYPGLLTLSGDVEDAIEVHLLATALWTRFSAMPERWNVVTGSVDNDMSWWSGRPEFVESTYYLYRATKDPWYLHVGEMVSRDIKRRCWTRCGWAGLEDVRSGKLSDRMESFFLGETAKYLFLLFDSEHPLNHLDAPFVFSTEGHPLVLPKGKKGSALPKAKTSVTGACEVAPSPPPLTLSSTAARSDIFHASSLARLHLMPRRDKPEGPLMDYGPDHPSMTLSDLVSPTNDTYYPWTLPPERVPFNATSSPMTVRPTLDIQFPNFPGIVLGPSSIERVQDGVLLKAIGGLRLGLVQDVPLFDGSSYFDGYRVQTVGNIPLGKDEKVYISRQLMANVLDPNDVNFARIADSVLLNVVIDVDPARFKQRGQNESVSTESIRGHRTAIIQDDVPSDKPDVVGGSGVRTTLSSLMDQATGIMQDDRTEPPSETTATTSATQKHRSQAAKRPARMTLPAIMSTGPGAAPLPVVAEARVFAANGSPSTDPLSWSHIYLTDQLCDHSLPPDVPLHYEVLVVKRGGCSFSTKLRNIPSLAPPASGTGTSYRSKLQLVIVVSSDEPGPPSNDGGSVKRQPFISTAPHGSPLYPAAALAAEPFLVQPHLDEPQSQPQHAQNGGGRHRPVSMVMVGGGEETYALLRSASGIGLQRRYVMVSQGVPIMNLCVI